MGPPYPHFCILHFGGKGTEFSSPNRSKPLCHKGFPFCHYYTLMAYVRYHEYSERRRYQNRFRKFGSRDRCLYAGYLWPCNRKNEKRQLKPDAEIHRIHRGMKARCGAVAVQIGIFAKEKPLQGLICKGSVSCGWRDSNPHAG